jgi:hypothetical protein
LKPSFLIHSPSISPKHTKAQLKKTKCSAACRGSLFNCKPRHRKRSTVSVPIMNMVFGSLAKCHPVPSTFVQAENFATDHILRAVNCASKFQSTLLPPAGQLCMAFQTKNEERRAVPLVCGQIWSSTNRLQESQVGGGYLAVAGGKLEAVRGGEAASAKHVL